MYVQHDTEAHSYHRCSRKAISVTYSDCVFIALGIQHKMHLRHIVICGLSGSAMCVHIISQTVRFSKEKKKVTECKMRVLICSTTLV
jgi:hypothetical protein